MTDAHKSNFLDPEELAAMFLRQPLRNTVSISALLVISLWTSWTLAGLLSPLIG